MALTSASAEGFDGQFTLGEEGAGSLRVTQDARRGGRQRVLACANKDASPSAGQPHAWRQGGGRRAYLVLGVLVLLAFELLALKLRYLCDGAGARGRVMISHSVNDATMVLFPTPVKYRTE